jgi:hydroxymethylbilane synthase
MTFRLGTRGSPLALWQARHVAALLEPVAGRPVELVVVDTHGDRDRATALRDMGGFGVFTKAIQDAVLDGRADLAVHSLKDLPTDPTDGTALAGTPARGPTGDAFVSNSVRKFDDLPRGAVVGTSSLRRRAQALHRRPDLAVVDLRGNVDTRLRKLDEGAFAAVILAEAGLVRLGLGHRISEVLDPDWMLPAVGQGAVGLEGRAADPDARRLAEAITDPDTWARVSAERAMLAAVGGGCLVPIGVTSRVADGLLAVRGAVLSADGRRRVMASHRGPADAPLAVGQELAAMLLAEGAGELLAR